MIRSRGSLTLPFSAQDWLCSDLCWVTPNHHCDACSCHPALLVVPLLIWFAERASDGTFSSGFISHVKAGEDSSAGWLCCLVLKGRLCDINSAVCLDKNCLQHRLVGRSVSVVSGCETLAPGLRDPVVFPHGICLSRKSFKSL